jgi:polysaccharide export outer membrane protein
VKSIKLLLFISFIGFLSSCISVKKLTYLQDTEEPLEVDTAGYQMLKRSYYKVQKYDMLSIQIKSIDEATTNYFRIGQGNGVGNVGGGNRGSAAIYFTGYSVDEFGNIDFPVLNEVYVEGLTIHEIQELLLVKLSKYFDTSNLFVKAQLAGIKFTVIGEIGGGQYYLYQNEANIFEALAQAGDIATLGNKKEVQIIRQHPQGVKYYEVDLTSKAVVNNPMYFIQPNDIINVKPMKQKTWGVGTTGVQSFLTFASLITTTAALVVLIQSFSN